jgi:protocatechuate 3,4-dioxygenase beta subunit
LAHQASADIARDAFAASIPGCVVRPEQTEGPYFIDEKLHRSDIRLDPSDNSIKPGVPMRLEFQVSTVAANSCRPLTGAMVDVWHCDALGVYSDVHDSMTDSRGKKFLRGYQVTDEKGSANFLTVYPGWYEGRAVHVHFKIRTNPSTKPGFDFTSQLYFDDSVTDRVHRMAPYKSKGRRTVTNDRDGVFRRGGKQLIPELIKDEQGYFAKLAIGLRVT